MYKRPNLIFWVGQPLPTGYEEYYTHPTYNMATAKGVLLNLDQ